LASFAEMPVELGALVATTTRSRSVEAAAKRPVVVPVSCDCVALSAPACSTATAPSAFEMSRFWALTLTRRIETFPGAPTCRPDISGHGDPDMVEHGRPKILDPGRPRTVLGA
jgi:hypothetical protein